MQQPPSDRSNKNPFATPSAWPRAPQQTFHLRVPKPPAGTQAAKPAPKPAAPPPRPARPGSSILTGSALPVGREDGPGDEAVVVGRDLDGTYVAFDW